MPLLLPQGARRLLSPWFTSALLLCVAFNQLTFAETNRALVLPQDSLGYLHIQVDELRNVPAFATFTKLFGHVATEASFLSTTKLGLDLTTLSDLTFIAPSAEQLDASRGTANAPWCVVATFSKSFRVADFSKQLQGDWQASNAAERLFVRGTDQAIHVISNTSLVYGTPAGVEWWIHTEPDTASGSLTEMLNNSLQAGHILFGVDVEQLPDDRLSILPPSAQWLAKVNLAGIDLFLGDDISAAGYFYFDHETDATNAQGLFKNMVADATEALAQFEKQTKPLISDPATSTDAATQALVTLALGRQAAETLEDIEVTQEEGTVIVRLSVDDNMLVYLTGSAAIIQQIGQNAGAPIDASQEPADDEASE